MSSNVCKLFLGLVLFFYSAAAGISAEGIRDNTGSVTSVNATGEASTAPLMHTGRISIFSSGVAYFEYSGTLNGPAVINLPFKPNVVNDVLKSLVVYDPSSTNPFVLYQSENTLLQTLRSLRIDISDNPDMAVILARLRGAEVEITVPSPVSGRIVGIEYRTHISPIGEVTREPRLSLITDKGLQLFNLVDINSLNFTDPEIGNDLNRALDLILLSRNSDSRDITVHLPGSGSRNVSLSYVIPAPVWKVSYRLDLSHAAAGDGENESKALLQGWAIVDNDSDSDWRNVELSLVAGRPTSFIQNLYPPYYVFRPYQPLAIAGAAAAVTHDSGFVAMASAESFDEDSSVARRDYLRAAPVPTAPPAMDMSNVYGRMEQEASGRSGLGSGGVVETATGTAAGDQFEFTINHPVNLDRRMSTMLPLTESFIEAQKLLVFSGANMGSAGRSRNPRLGAELTNTSGMKLPAGPITVYDGGTYAGDALIEFWNDGEKRLISFGDDLSVNGTAADLVTVTMTSVNISKGVMTINRSRDYNRTYTFVNNASHEKTLIVEHPVTQGTVLKTPQAVEQTPTIYRFRITLDPGKETVLQITETRVLTEGIMLLQLRPDAFLSYISNQEVPQNVRESLQQAVALRSAISAAETEVTRAESRRTFLLSEQDRVRRNIEAVGDEARMRQDYLTRLQSLDNEIDNLIPELERLREAVANARKAYEDYLNGLNL